MINDLLESQLRPVAREYRRLEILQALIRCWIGFGLAAMALLFLARRAVWSSPWTFWVLAMGGIATAAAIIYRFRTSPLDYRALARQLETEDPELQSLLLTAVEQEPSSPGAGLNYLQQRVIAEALERHRRSAWGRRISERIFRARSIHWSLVAGCVVILAALRPGSPAGGTFRLSARNSITVTPGDTNVERGSGLVVLARFNGKVPAEAALVMIPVNENERRLPLAKNLDDPVFGAAIPEVTSDFRYRIELSAGRTREFQVTVFDYPRLERADAKIVYPGYTGLGEKVIRDTRRISAVEGSSLDYAFYLNKPVAAAKLLSKNQAAVPLSVDPNHPTIYHARFPVEESRRYELLLADESGRTNKLPPEFIIEALQNRYPDLKLAFPRGDQRVSPLQEITFEGEASDDFGLRAFGVGYTLAGEESKLIELGKNSKPNEKRPIRYVLPLESLGAQPDQLLNYYLWADDIGPDGAVRRTTSDMYFVEVRPFDEIFREGQSGESPENSASGAGGQSPTEKLMELQKQIISATWNLQRREKSSKPSTGYRKDAAVVRDSQENALEQARERKEKVEDARTKGLLDSAGKEMERALAHLNEAQNSAQALSPALGNEQSALQALMRLQAREYQVSRSRQRQGGGGSSSMAQRQLDQLDLKQSENRYETQRQAAPAQRPEQREQLQVLSRLKELAERQQDLNARIQELQTALQEAKTEKEREEVRRQLKRLREEQQDLLADVDELRQRMERPENQSRMAEARQQLDQVRSQVERAAEALGRNSASQALASGTRAERELQQLHDDFRKKSFSQFADDMRRMREEARQLAQKQEEIGKKFEDLSNAKQKTLGDSDDRRELAKQLGQQKGGLTNLFNQMRQVSEQSETAEPLLSKQLYDLLRQTSQDDVNKAIDFSSELLQRGFMSQANQFEQHTRRDVDTLKRGVEHAAESVLGDDTEALRLAKRELDDLSQQLEKELAQAAAAASTNRAALEPASGQEVRRDSSGSNAVAQASGAGSGRAGSQRNPDRASPNDNGPNRVSSQQGGDSTQDQANAANGGSAGNRQSGTGNQSTRTLSGRRFAGQDRPAGATGLQDGAAEGARGGGGDDPGLTGPLTGDDFTDWSDRLRNVEEMLDLPDLRAELARIRGRARAARLDFKRQGKKPDWAVVHLQIAAPLAEVRTHVSEELSRRESKDSLAPIDRDPVPPKFSELVRRYYERLGKSD